MSFQYHVAAANTDYHLSRTAFIANIDRGEKQRRFGSPHASLVHALLSGAGSWGGGGPVVI